MKHSPLFYVGTPVLFLLMTAAFLLSPLAAQAQTAAHTITYHRPLHAGTLVDGRTVQIAVENFKTATDGTLVLNSSQAATLGTPVGSITDDVTVTAFLDGVVIGTNTVGPFDATTALTPLVLQVTTAVPAGSHRFALLYSAAPTVGQDTTVCDPDPQGCSPITLSRGRLTLTTPRRA